MTRLPTITLLILATAVLFAGASGVVLADDTVTATVTVVDTDGEPVPDVVLTATWDGGSSTETTRSNGKAFVDVPSGADVTIAIEHDEFIRNHEYEFTDASEREVEVLVFPKAESTVTVVDGDGTVAEDALVSFRDDGGTVKNVHTDSNGTTASGEIAEGEYSIVVEKDGFYRELRTTSISGEHEIQIEILRGSVVIDFSVVDEGFEQPRPVEGMTIFARDGAIAVKTLDDGEASARVPVNTPLTATAEKEGYVTEQRTVQIQEKSRTVEFSVVRTPSLSVVPLSERVVVGETNRITVVDEYDRPVAGTTVYYDGEDVGETDDDGVIDVTISQAGDTSIVAEVGGLSSEPVTVEGVSDSSADDGEEANDDEQAGDAGDDDGIGDDERLGDDDGTDADADTGADDDGSDVEPDDADEASGMPGFTAVGGVVALFLTGLLLRSRRTG